VRPVKTPSTQKKKTSDPRALAALAKPKHAPVSTPEVEAAPEPFWQKATKDPIKCTFKERPVKKGLSFRKLDTNCISKDVLQKALTPTNSKHLNYEPKRKVTPQSPVGLDMKENSCRQHLDQQRGNRSLVRDN
jgi:hypothetical protein